ncbi:hypothetical protein FRB98_006413 [Tulasnella sp. 332]|nr:hypothetical protein FRB98_006413 [Tulasnella sp. 332]
MRKTRGQAAKDKRINAQELRQRNETQAIYSLPEHILLDIFLYILLEAKEYDRYYENICLLSLVSAGWASLIRDSPSLWGFIHCSHSAQTHDIALSRSKQSPIDIIVKRKAGKRRCDTTLIQRLITQRHRWRSVNYIGLYERCWLVDLLGVQAPALEDLQVLLAGSSYMADLFGGQASSLKYLHLSGCAVDWSSNMLSGLRTLKLSSLYSFGPSVDEVVKILRASPTLVDLDLGDFECAVPNDGRELQAKPVELPHLAKFKFGRLPLLATQALLRVLRIPKCLDFTLHVQSDTSTGLFDASMYHITSVVQNILASKIVKFQPSIDISGGEIRVERRDKTADLLQLSVAIGGDLQPTQIERLVKVLESPRAVDPDKPLITRLWDDIPLSTILPILLSSCRIQHLKMTGMTPGEGGCLDGVLRCLGEPITTDNTTRWPIPMLKTITMNHIQPDIDVLLDMVRHRYGADLDLDSAEAGLQSVERPAALETLAISYPFQNSDVEKVQRLRSVLGEGVLKCYWLGDD